MEQLTLSSSSSYKTTGWPPHCNRRSDCKADPLPEFRQPMACFTLLQGRRNSSLAGFKWGHLIWTEGNLKQLSRPASTFLLFFQRGRKISSRHFKADMEGCVKTVRETDIISNERSSLYMCEPDQTSSISRITFLDRIPKTRVNTFAHRN